MTRRIQLGDDQMINWRQGQEKNEKFIFIINWQMVLYSVCVCVYSFFFFHWFIIIEHTFIYWLAHMIQICHTKNSINSWSNFILFYFFVNFETIFMCISWISFWHQFHDKKKNFFDNCAWNWIDYIYSLNTGKVIGPLAIKI